VVCYRYRSSPSRIRRCLNSSPMIIPSFLDTRSKVKYESQSSLPPPSNGLLSPTTPFDLLSLGLTSLKTILHFQNFHHPLRSRFHLRTQTANPAKIPTTSSVDNTAMVTAISVMVLTWHPSGFVRSSHRSYHKGQMSGLPKGAKRLGVVGLGIQVCDWVV